jgi:hypothetical protein
MRRAIAWLAVIVPLAGCVGWVFAQGGDYAVKSQKLFDHEQRIQKLETRDEMLFRIDENVKRLRDDVQELRRGKP